MRFGQGAIHGGDHRDDDVGHLSCTVVFLVTAYVLLVSDFGLWKAELLVSLGFSIFCVVRTLGFFKIN
jgi:hypothetical protein